MICIIIAPNTHYARCHYTMQYSCNNYSCGDNRVVYNIFACRIRWIMRTYKYMLVHVYIIITRDNVATLSKNVPKSLVRGDTRRQWKRMLYCAEPSQRIFVRLNYVRIVSSKHDNIVHYICRISERKIYSFGACSSPLDRRSCSFLIPCGVFLLLKRRFSTIADDIGKIFNQLI